MKKLTIAGVAIVIVLGLIWFLSEETREATKATPTKAAETDFCRRNQSICHAAITKNLGDESQRFRVVAILGSTPIGAQVLIVPSNDNHGEMGVVVIWSIHNVKPFSGAIVRLRVTHYRNHDGSPIRLYTVY